MGIGRLAQRFQLSLNFLFLLPGRRVYKPRHVYSNGNKKQRFLEWRFCRVERKPERRLRRWKEEKGFRVGRVECDVEREKRRAVLKVAFNNGFVEVIK